MKAVPRPTLTEKQKLTIMSRYCRCPGIPEIGVECGKHLPAMSDCEFDHIAARALGGSDEIENYRPLCPTCHRTKTSGRRGEKRSTSYGSDAHAIAKVRRNEKANAEFMRAVSTKGEREKPAAAKPKRAWPKQTFRKRTAR